MKKCRIVLIYLLLARQIYAQNEPQVWTLSQCIQYAVENNIQLKQIEQSKNREEANLNTAKLSRLPSISASAGQNIDIGRSPSKDGTIKDQSSLNSNFYLQSSIPLFTGLKNKNEIIAQEWNVSASVQNLQKAKDDVRVNVFSSYMQVLFKREIEKIAQEQVLLCSNQVRRTEILVENGKIAKSQLYSMKAQLARDEVTLVNATNEVSLALLDLILSMNLDIAEGAFDISTLDFEHILSEYMLFIPSPEIIYHEALSFRPHIMEQEYFLEGLQYTLKAAKSGYYPNLSLNASYSNYYYRFIGLDNFSFSDQWKQNARKTIGLTLSVPIFNRFQVRNSVRIAQIAVTNQKLAIADAYQTLYKEIRQVYSNAVAAQKVCLSSEISVQSTRKSFLYAEESYNADQISVFEYNEAKTKYIQSLSEQKQAIFDLIFRCKLLEFYSGKPF